MCLIDRTTPGVSRHRHIRVGFDARWHNSSGVGTYVRELLVALAKQAYAEDTELIVYSSKPIPAFIWDLPYVSIRTVSTKKYSLSDQLSFAFLTMKDNLDLLHVPVYVAPVLAPIPVVVTMHDLETFLLPYTVHSRLARYAIRAMHHLAARKAAAVIAVSRDTSKDIREYLRIPPHKEHIVLNAASDCFDLRPEDANAWLTERCKLRLTKPYILAMVGKQVEKKNTLRVWHSIKLLREKGYDVALALVGDIKWTRDALPQLTAAERSGEVVTLGYVTDDTLRRLYHNSLLFLFPSLHEGFGLPILEAMRAGSVVVTSRRSAMPEVAGRAGVLVDPEDTAGLASAMMDVVSWTEQTRAERIAIGQCHAKEFSWERTARETLAVYRTTARKQGATTEARGTP